MGDDRTRPSGDEVHRAAERRIRDEAIRLLEEVRPDDDDDWRLRSLDPDHREQADDSGSSDDASEASSSARPDDSG